MGGPPNFDIIGNSGIVGGGGGGTPIVVTAADSSIVIGGTPTAPTVKVGAVPPTSLPASVASVSQAVAPSLTLGGGI